MALASKRQSKNSDTAAAARKPKQQPLTAAPRYEAKEENESDDGLPELVPPSRSIMWAVLLYRWIMLIVECMAESPQAKLEHPLLKPPSFASPVRRSTLLPYQRSRNSNHRLRSHDLRPMKKAIRIPTTICLTSSRRPVQLCMQRCCTNGTC